MSQAQCIKFSLTPLNASFMSSLPQSVRLLSKPPSPRVANDHPHRTPGDFLDALLNSSVTIRPGNFFNHPEVRVFYAAQNALKELNLPRWHVHGQVSYGRIFRTFFPENYEKSLGFNPHSAFNSKSADVVIADNEGRPVLVIEYQGSGHDARNDPIKKLVCQKAGVPFYAVHPVPMSDKQPYLDVVDTEGVKAFIVKAIRNRQHKPPQAPSARKEPKTAFDELRVIS